MTQVKKYRFPRANYTIKLDGKFRNEKGILVHYRYVQGETTLVAKEQSEEVEPEYLHVNTNPMAISDPLIQEFIEMLPEFGERITVYDPSLLAKKTNDGVEQAIEALNIVKMADLAKIMPVAYLIFGKDALSKDPHTLRGLLYAESQENPAKIIEAFDDKKNAKHLFVGLAFAKGIIEESVDGRKVNYVHNGQTLCTISKGETGIEAVASYIDTKDGASDKQQIAQMLNQEVVEKVANDATSKAKASTSK